MKRFIVLAIIVAASLTAFPQVTRTERTSKNGKTTVKKENVAKTNENSEKKTGAVRSTSTRSAAGTKTEAVRQTGQQQATRPVGRSVNAADQSGATRKPRGVNTARHQNDEIFTKSRYKVDYENTEDLRKSEDFRRNYDEYNNWRNVRVVRRPGNYARYRPVPVEIRRERYVYRQPNHYELVWTPYLFNRFVFYYPGHDRWNIELGREIGTISAYDVLDYVGSVQRVYGKVDEVYYSREDGNYILYIGAPFPYHDMSVVIPRSVCREITVSPEWYFRDQYIWFIGLIDLWEEKPEVVIRDEEQIRRY